MCFALAVPACRVLAIVFRDAALLVLTAFPLGKLDFLKGVQQTEHSEADHQERR
jgi:hypothetical protein